MESAKGETPEHKDEKAKSHGRDQVLDMAM